ncbi:MAG: hypothetical protein FWE68_03385 [Defluviitaleaceae bacterium]|nr:hypothetical protein [Defluviitaleaceae bacterium]
MEYLLMAREITVRFCKRYEIFIVFVLKFIFGMIIFAMISEIGRPIDMLEQVSDLATGWAYITLMSLIFAITPINAGYLLITVNLILQTSAVLEVALLLGLFLFAVQGLYTRLAPQECVLILFMLTAYYFRLPYLIPILAGLYYSMTAIIPIAIAVFMWQFLPLLRRMFRAGEDTVFDIGGLTEVYEASYAQVVGALASNHDWVIISFIFAMVVLVVYAIAHTSIDYSKDIAIALGGVVTVIGFVAVVLVTDVRISLPGMIMSTLISVAVAYVIRFFDVLLDYNRAERVQFQDEDNVYYVKIVPKMLLGDKVPEPEAVRRPDGIRGPTDNERNLVRVADPAPTRPERYPAAGAAGSEGYSGWAKRWEKLEEERAKAQKDKV